MSVLENFRWPSLARDLAVMQTPGSPITDFGDIYETYGITEDELKTVIQIPAFQQMYRDELAGFRSQGSKAASLYRTGTLSQALMEHDPALDSSSANPVENRAVSSELDLKADSADFLTITNAEILHIVTGG